MACLISLAQLLLVASILFQHTTALPVLERTQDDVEGLTRRKIEQLNYLVARNFVEDLLDERLSVPEVSRLQTRQLGDIEFSNKYAEFLRTKAKLCSFLRGMQYVKKSAPREDAEGVNQLLKQYMCPGGLPVRSLLTTPESD